MIYFIIGFKNSGKTTLGKMLSKRLKMGFLDLDEYIENKYGKTIPEIYTSVGEEKFRNIEWLALKEVVKNDNLVISTGGGAPCNCDNMNIMEKHGEVIYLSVSDETLLNRLLLVSNERPIIYGKSKEELKNYITDLRQKCEHHYKRARYTVDGENINIEEIVRIISCR